MAARRRGVVPLSRADAALCRKTFGQAPTTDALPLLPADADEMQWLAMRRGTVGASEIAAVLDASPYTSRFALWWRKKMGWDIDPTEEMCMGRKLEAVIGEVFAERHPDLLLFRPNAALFAHPQHGRLTCTPDFLAVQRYRLPDDTPQSPVRVRLYPVECKSDQGGQGWGTPGTDEVPEHHKYQGWQQAEILNATGTYFPRLNGKRFSWYYVPYTASDQGLMRATYIPMALDFLDSIDAGEQPPLDGSPSTTEVLERLHADMDPEATAMVPAELAERFRAAHAEREFAKQEYDKAANELRAAMGRARYAADPDGKRVMRRDIYKRREFVMPATTVDRVVAL